MAVRANEVALSRFLDQASQTSAELSEAKLLRRWISMMELQSLRACGVATIDTASAVRANEIELSFPAPLPQRPPELLAASIAPGARSLLLGSGAERHLRGVVFAERRALQAEASPIQRPHLSVDNHLGQKLPPAGDANERFRGAWDRLAGSFEWPVRVTVQTVFTTAEVAPPTIGSELDREFPATDHTFEHASDRT